MERTKFFSAVVTAVFSTIVFATGTIAQAQSPGSHKVIFYVTRHGETILNRLQRAQGWSDAPLTREGKEAAHFLGIGLMDTSFVAVYSSDLGRAIETAETVLENRPELRSRIQKDPALRESGFGSYEGDLGTKMWNDAALYMHYTSFAELMKAMQKGNKIPDVLASIKALDTLGIAENFDDVKNRMNGWIQKVSTEIYQNGGGNVLVVSHGIAISVLLNAVVGPAYIGKQLGNASVTRIEYDGKSFKVLSIGDLKYVEDGMKANR